MANFDQQLTTHIAHLAKIPISKKETEQLTQAFQETLEVVDQLQSLDVENVEPSHQVTGLTNVWREDKVDQDAMFTQEQALANAPQQHQGYFVVERIIDLEE